MGKGGGEGEKKQRTMLHPGSHSRSGRFRLGPSVIFTEAAPGLRRFRG